MRCRPWARRRLRRWPPAPEARKWFQLYIWKDRTACEELMTRAKAAGFEALMLTVDVPVAGLRLRDIRNGFSIPPALTVKTVVEAADQPAHHHAPLLRFLELVGSHGRRAYR